MKVSKLFKPVKYDTTNITFTDFSVHSDHAMAIDQNGVLYGWGSNLSKRSGFKEDIFDGVFEPRKVAFLALENLRAIKVKCGFDHTLMIAEGEDQVQRLYSIGQDETNFYQLGI